LFNSPGNVDSSDLISNRLGSRFTASNRTDKSAKPCLTSGYPRGVQPRTLDPLASSPCEFLKTRGAFVVHRGFTFDPPHSENQAFSPHQGRDRPGFMNSPTTESTFDAWAQNGRAEGMEQSHRPRALLALQQISIEPGHKSLDLGCGNGWATRWLAQAAGPTGHAEGVDLSAKMIARACTLEPGQSQVAFQQASFSTLPFRDATFDHAFSMESLYYAEDLARALAEISRVLVEGGTLCVCTDFYAENPYCLDWPEMMQIPMQLLSQGEWVDALERAGFHGVRTHRCLDSSTVSADTPEEERHFHQEIGALAILGFKGGLPGDRPLEVVA
jgi:SAM-dependent methyltransferase